MIQNNQSQILNEAKFEEHIGKEMVHLAKFKAIPQFCSISWVNTVCQGSGDFINAWNTNNNKRKKNIGKVDEMLDKAYKEALKEEESDGNDVSKLPKERPEEYTFEFLTNQDAVQKYMDDHLVNRNNKIETYRYMSKNKQKLKYDKDGNTIKKY